MNENFFHLLSECECMISIDGENIGTIDNQNNFEIDILCKKENVFITYTPISNQKNYIPYTFSLSNNDNLTNNNPNINIIPFPNNHYDIILKPFEYNPIFSAKMLLSKSLGNYFVTINNSNISTINIFSGTNILYSTKTQLLKQADVNINKNLLVLKGIINEYKYYILVINVSNLDIIYNEIVDSIEDTKTQIQTLKALHDISHHAIVCNIDFNTQKSNFYHVFEDNKCRYPHSSYLIPKAFLQCLIHNDEKTAKYYLSEIYINSNISQFIKFFNSPQEIYLNRHSITSKLNYTIKTKDNYKNYNFILENDKIKDIEEVF